MNDPGTVIFVYLIAAVVSVLVLYFVIRLAVTHALRSHVIWTRAGGKVRGQEERDHWEAVYRENAKREPGTPFHTDADGL